MHALPAEAGVVGGGNDEAAIEHVLDAGNGTRQIRQQRRCAFLDDTRGRVRPSDDVALSTRRGFFPEQHRAGHGDGLAVEPRRAVEDAIGRGVLDRAAYLRPHAQDGARLGGGDLVAADVAERVAGTWLHRHREEQCGEEGSARGRIIAWLASRARRR